MSSDHLRKRGLAGTAAFLLVLALTVVGRGAGPRFYPDDPLWVDEDAKFDAGKAQEINLSEGFDFLENTFGAPGRHDQLKAVNVNTVDEVPDSSWFTNRIGRRALSIAEIVRGPDRADTLETDEWLVTAGKGPAGFQPGFRAVDARSAAPIGQRQLYQLELDTRPFPEMATGAEMVGTLIYHAIGYNVVDTYVVHVDPKKVRIAPGTTVRDASGRRPFVQADLDEIFRLGKRDADGTYRMTASRFVEGRPVGNFKHYGTRPDDPNDIFPHEDRRELRANRVFAAWLNHDDSRAVNTLDMLVGEEGHRSIRHYMFDFGSILGSSPERRYSGREYLIERGPTLAGLFSLGLWIERWQFINAPAELFPTVGRFQGDSFEPEKWKPEYPNQAFKNLRPDDAFWAARIVAAFSDEAVGAVVKKAAFSQPAVTDYLTSALIKRRDKIAKVWLNVVNPLTDFTLAADGTLSFENVAVNLKAATAGGAYTLSWSKFDNVTDTSTSAGSAQTVPGTTAQAPLQALAGSEYITVSVRGSHPDHPAWSQPVQAYFHREGGTWKTVGLEHLK